MERAREALYRLHPYLLASIASVLTVAQIALAFFLHGDGPAVSNWAGWICLWISAIFGVLPVFTLRKKGGVAQGDSYMNTSVLVDSGIYAIVRHPQGGTAWLLINLGLILIAWHWTSAALGLVSMALVYADTFKADQDGIAKFGRAYRCYMERTPRVNFVAGIVRLRSSHGEERGG